MPESVKDALDWKICVPPYERTRSFLRNVQRGRLVVAEKLRTAFDAVVLTGALSSKDILIRGSVHDVALASVR